MGQETKQDPGGGNGSRGHEGVLLSALLSVVCSAGLLL